MTKKGSPPRSPSRRSTEESEFEREFPGGSESANASVVALFLAFDACMATFNKATSRYGLSPAGRQALAVLEGADGPLSPTEISQRLFVTTASTTSLLDTLERRGLVERLPDPDDRRKVLVTLTDEARRIVDSLLPEMIAVQTAVMASLSEAERTRLQRSLAAIHRAATELDVDEIVDAALPRRKPKRG